jgi:hypothetical protein
MMSNLGRSKNQSAKPQAPQPLSRASHLPVDLENLSGNHGSQIRRVIHGLVDDDDGFETRAW